MVLAKDGKMMANQAKADGEMMVDGEVKEAGAEALDTVVMPAMAMMGNLCKTKTHFFLLKTNRKSAI